MTCREWADMADDLMTALHWVIEHKHCSDFPRCWVAAPIAMRDAVVGAWGSGSVARTVRTVGGHA